MYENLPEPRLFEDQDSGQLFLQMEWNYKVVQERLPRHFLKMDEDQQAWHISANKIVQKLWKKLNFKNPNG